MLNRTLCFLFACAPFLFSCSGDSIDNPFDDENPIIQPDPTSEQPDTDDNCLSDDYTFCDDFSGTMLSDAWQKIERQTWGPSAESEVLPENVSVSDGYLRLRAHGDQYIGPILRRNPPQAHGRRVGAAISTVELFGSGEYEVRMRVSPQFGAVSAMWTFQYEEFPEGSPEYIANNGEGPVWISNHEIDFELPGNAESFDYVLMNAWTGVRGNAELEAGQQEISINSIDTRVNQADGQFRTYKFVWSTGENEDRSDAYVDFYIDDVPQLSLNASSGDPIPWKKGELWLGVWFPDGWAGEPNFSQSELTISYFKYTAFEGTNDVDITLSD